MVLIWLGSVQQRSLCKLAEKFMLTARRQRWLCLMHSLCMQSGWPEVRNLTRASFQKPGKTTTRTRSYLRYLRSPSWCSLGRCGQRIRRLCRRQKSFLSTFQICQNGSQIYGFSSQRAYLVLRVLRSSVMEGRNSIAF